MRDRGLQSNLVNLKSLGLEGFFFFWGGGGGGGCVALFLGYNQYWPGGSMCFFVVLCPGASEGSTSSGSGFKAFQKMGQ